MRGSHIQFCAIAAGIVTVSLAIAAQSLKTATQLRIFEAVTEVRLPFVPIRDRLRCACVHKRT